MLIETLIFFIYKHNYMEALKELADLEGKLWTKWKRLKDKYDLKCHHLKSMGCTDFPPPPPEIEEVYNQFLQVKADLFFKKREYEELPPALIEFNNLPLHSRIYVFMTALPERLPVYSNIIGFFMFVNGAVKLHFDKAGNITSLKCITSHQASAEFDILNEGGLVFMKALTHREIVLE